MKDWRFRYHDNPSALIVCRRVKPFPSIVFHPYTMSEWLTAKGLPVAASRRWLPREHGRPTAPTR